MNLKNRKLINILSKIYYRIMPDFILRSEKFHRLIFNLLIGPWFKVNFRQEYQHYSPGDWQHLYDSPFDHRIRNEDLTYAQKNHVLSQIRGPDVFEIGSGTGTMIEAIIEESLADKISSNDISPKAIAFLKDKFKNYPHISFIEGDFLTANIPSVSNTLLCLHVLEHIPDAACMAKKMAKIAQRIIIIVPREEEHPYSPDYHVHFFNQPQTLFNLFPKRKNKLQLIDGDFVLISDQ